MVVGRWARLVAVGSAFVALTGGCGGIARLSDSGTGGGGATGNGAATGDGASGAGAPAMTDTTAERVRACRLYYTVLFASPCSGPVLPASELSRLAPLFEQSCVGEFDMPGNANTAEALTACANALELDNCQFRNGPPRECDFRGSLPAEAPCIVGTQCQSGSCNGTTYGFRPGRPSGGDDTCGTCGAVAKIGDPCWPYCEKGARCISTPNARDPSVCRAITEKDVAEPCDHETQLCKPGLYCNDSRSVCERLPALHEPCSSDLCAPTLGCHRGQISTGGRAKPTCEPPGNAGDDCSSTFGPACASGLRCVWDNRDATNRCVPFSWAGPREPCDDTHRCLVRECSYEIGNGAPRGTCPKTVPDGQPCTSENECDTLSHCLNLSAPEGATTGICGSISRVVCAR